MSNIVDFDSSINSFLTKIINTKNNQTKEDIISVLLIYMKNLHLKMKIIFY